MSGVINLNDACIAQAVVTGDGTTPVFQTPGGRGFAPTITRLAAGDYVLRTSPLYAFDGLDIQIQTRSVGGGTGPVSATVLNYNSTVAGAFRVLMKDAAATPTAVDADFSVRIFKLPQT